MEASGRSSSAVTLYLHGLGFGEHFWDFDAVPGYDYGRDLAEAGHASILIDELGYGNSGHPSGSLTCLGAQADVAHQIIEELRNGMYHIEGSRPTAFRKVGLVGHSAGGLIAQLEAYSFHDIDVLGVMAYGDEGPSAQAIGSVGQAEGTCQSGAGYAFFGRSRADFAALMFHDDNPSVVAAAAAARYPDPCGDLGSLLPGIVEDLAGVPTIRVPAILIYGADDALFPPPTGLVQRTLYLSDRDVVLVTLPEAGHALTLGRRHLALESRMIAWLHGHHM